MLSLLSDGRVSWTTIALHYLSAASRGSGPYEQAQGTLSRPESAVDRCQKASGQVAACALIVDAKDDTAERIDELFGLRQVMDRDPTAYLPVGRQTSAVPPRTCRGAIGCAVTVP